VLRVDSHESEVLRVRNRSNLAVHEWGRLAGAFCSRALSRPCRLAVLGKELGRKALASPRP
jgi:hypothetical protein